MMEANVKNSNSNFNFEEILQKRKKVRNAIFDSSLLVIKERILINNTLITRTNPYMLHLLHHSKSNSKASRIDFDYDYDDDDRNEKNEKSTSNHRTEGQGQGQGQGKGLGQGQGKQKRVTWEDEKEKMVKK